MSNQTCKTCKWWGVVVDNKTRHNPCFRYPKTILPSPAIQAGQLDRERIQEATAWPEMFRDAYCGEWALRITQEMLDFREGMRLHHVAMIKQQDAGAELPKEPKEPELDRMPKRRSLWAWLRGIVEGGGPK